MADQTNPRKIGRLPIIPMDFNDRDKSVKGEVMIDTEERKMYFKRLDGNIVPIHDRTEEEAEASLDFNAALGGGKPLAARYQFDKKSIVDNNYVVQLEGFNNAKSDYIPFKGNDGFLVWRDKYDAVRSAMSRNVIEAFKGVNDYVVLREGNFYIAKDIETPAIFKLPSNTETSYSQIIMKLITTESIDYSIDATNVIWEYNDDAIFIKNATRFYRFETWNYGNSWYITTKTIGNPSHITNKFLDDKYYTKTEIEELLTWSYIDPVSKSNNNIFKIRSVNSFKNYDELIEKDNNTFYFIEDTCQIYRGEYIFTQPYKLVTEFPTENIARGLMYINTNTLSIKVYNTDDNWVEVSKPVIDSIVESITEDNDSLVTKEAIINYLNNKTELSLPEDLTKTDTFISPNALYKYIESMTITSLDDKVTEKLITYALVQDYIRSLKVASINNITDEEYKKIKDNIPTVDAMKTYADSLQPTSGYIDIIDYDNMTGQIKVFGTASNEPILVTLGKQIISIEFDKNTDIISYTNGAGETIEYKLNGSRNIKTIEFNKFTNSIEIRYSDGESLNMDISDVLELCAPEQYTNTTSISYSQNNNITKFDVNISDAEDNALKLLDNGLYAKESMPILDKDTTTDLIVTTDQHGTIKSTIYSISDSTNSDNNALLVSSVIKNLITDATKISSKSTNILKWSTTENEEGFLAEIDPMVLENIVKVSSKRGNLLKLLTTEESEFDNGLYAEVTDTIIDDYNLMTKTIGEADKILLSTESGDISRSTFSINTLKNQFIGEENTITSDKVVKEYIDDSLNELNTYTTRISSDNYIDYPSTEITKTIISNIDFSSIPTVSIKENQPLPQLNTITIDCNGITITGECKLYKQEPINHNRTEIIDYSTVSLIAGDVYIYVYTFTGPENIIFSTVLNSNNIKLSDDKSTLYYSIYNICDNEEVV